MALLFCGVLSKTEGPCEYDSLQSARDQSKAQEPYAAPLKPKLTRARDLLPDSSGTKPNAQAGHRSHRRTAQASGHQ